MRRQIQDQPGTTSTDPSTSRMVPLYIDPAKSRMVPLDIFPQTHPAAVHPVIDPAKFRMVLLDIHPVVGPQPLQVE